MLLHIVRVYAVKQLRSALLADLLFHAIHVLEDECAQLVDQVLALALHAQRLALPICLHHKLLHLLNLGGRQIRRLLADGHHLLLVPLPVLGHDLQNAVRIVLGGDVDGHRLVFGNVAQLHVERADQFVVVVEHRVALVNLEGHLLRQSRRLVLARLLARIGLILVEQNAHCVVKLTNPNCHRDAIANHQIIRNEVHRLGR